MGPKQNLHNQREIFLFIDRLIYEGTAVFLINLLHVSFGLFCTMQFLPSVSMA